ncbi:Transglutaminase-like enzyme, putative cysteine protease [Rhizobium sp. RU35A]|uniref:transglutaminase family protein n=1 Tax=Rhizobium sp. RU35A TaxID=1907414 RepID=UPI00095496AE|nr:transglutaminase family protein [Rhizobium sp. RU35A]SIQ19749.1 Transglutaminase-like enzyme, putative cysteine protease [Rhizobium sp. RU35A]
MHLKITHTTEYLYDEPVAYALQRLRLTPLPGLGQTVLNWAVAVDGAKVEAGYRDQFDNWVELVSVEGGEHLIRVTARGEVETVDRTGIVGPHTGFVPLWLYLRETPRTRPGKLVRDLARSVKGDSELAQMHALMEAIHETVAYQPGSTDSETTAEQALEAKSGVCQDHAHIFIAAARQLHLPARYVSGYLLMDGQIEQVATHAWAEAHIPGLGWVGFDAANKICPDERYVRVATGLCYRDAAPVSGMRIGSAGENLKVSLTVAAAGTQSQSQVESGQSQTQA